jgi:drug/metabolite transporter (DMT)-like permease
MTLGMFLFGIGNAIIKGTGGTLSISQIIFLRGIFGLMFLGAYLPFGGGRSLLKSSNLKLQILRGTIGFFGLFFIFYSFQLLPLAEATAIAFSTALFVTALSMPILKERVGGHRWTAVVIGFLGILIIAQPTGVSTIYGASIALIASLFESLVMIYSRKLGKEDHSFTSVFYHTLLTFLIAATIAPFDWVTPTLEQLGFIALLALCGMLGQVAIVKAYSVAPAVVVAPMIYTLIIWAGLWGFLIWGEIPNQYLFVGAPIVVACGLYIVWKESKLGSEHIKEVEQV